MKEEDTIHPPRWATRFVEWYCKPQMAEDLLGDLNEFFERNLKEKGKRYARWIYVIDAFKFLRIYTIRRPQFLHLIIHWIMISSYIKTSGRSLLRNKLFSVINIAGLAISMSVGLLLISFLSDLKSYDQFNTRKDRIYRVISMRTGSDHQTWPFASTSVLAGKLIKENVAGVEEASIISKEFGTDVSYKDKTMPMDWTWADNSFLKIFTFPLSKGDPATALKEPYSVVVTQNAAKKLFGTEDPIGKTLVFDSLSYTVTGVLEDIPKFSHIQLEVVGSYATKEIIEKNNDKFLQWTNMWINYVYILLPENESPEKLTANLNSISNAQNANNSQVKIDLSLQPLTNIVIGRGIGNELGANMDPTVLWILGLLTFIVILSASFNYTNLSIARAMRRTREVGVRKVMGAYKSNVLWQFIFESIFISICALIFSVCLFIVIRPFLLGMAPEISEMISLQLDSKIVAFFILLAISVGLISGILPALFFARIRPAQVLKSNSAIKIFRHLNLRRTLIFVQYTISLVFITATVIGYYQYKGLLNFDLGYKTENIINVKLYGNKPEILEKEFSEIPEVVEISGSAMITSVGNYWGVTAKNIDTGDSVNLFFNIIDEDYIPLHSHRLLAGRNFKAKLNEKEENEIIVNEKLLKDLKITVNNPDQAIGKFIEVDGKKMAIIGVMPDFHYGKVTSELIPVAFRYNRYPSGFINLKIDSRDIASTMAKIEGAWKKVDKIHPMDAKFYKDQLEMAYDEFSAMIKLIGLLSVLAVSIASMGLLGMVVFTTETRLKEIGIRKALGADTGNIIYLLSKNFLFLLVTATLLAVPSTYLFFEKVILSDFAFHAPIRIIEVWMGFIIVGLIAFIMIGSQTFKVANTNPATVLKNE